MRKLMMGVALVGAAAAADLDAQGIDRETRRALEEALRSAEMARHGLGLAGHEIRHEAELAMQMAQMQLQSIQPGLHAAMIELGAALPHAFERGMSEGEFRRRLEGLEREAISLPQDPADSIWRQAREALNRSQFERAAELFRRIRTDDRFERSGYRAESFYWEAFALSRSGGVGELRAARELLTELQRSHPRSTSVRDAQELATLLDGRLARTGDARAAQALYSAAAIAEAERTATAVARAGVVSGAYASGYRNPQCPENEEEDIRIAALSALINVDSDNALPVLREALNRRDECSVPLRMRAIMLISRSRDPNAASTLVEVVRNDPDEQVRRQAVLFLGSVDTPEAKAALMSLLRESNDIEVQRHALMAIASQRDEQAGALMRDYASRTDIPEELRTQAIMMLMSRNRESTENAAFLRELYGSTGDESLKMTILSSLSRQRSAETLEWLMSVALDANASADLRRQALFAVGRSPDMNIDRLVRLYDDAADRDFKEQVLFTLARREEDGALDKLIDIARNESDIELRKRAIFWLGSRKDPRAAQALMDIVRR